MSDVRAARRAAAVAAVLAAPLLVAGCGTGSTSVSGELPACSTGEPASAANGVVLMAQAVPTATWVPCVESVPAGWTFAGLDAHAGSARFWLDSDRHGMRAIEVLLTEDCDTAGATEIASDREDLRRYERVTQVTPQYLGQRYYRYDGGCLTIAFRLAGESRSEPLALATHSIGVVSRQDVAEQVHRESGSRLQLDPPAQTRADEGDPP